MSSPALRKKCSLYRVAIRCVPFLATWPVCLHAVAGEGDTFTPYAEYGVFYDDNLLRLSSAQKDSAKAQGLDVSDRWQRASVGLRVNKPIGRQLISGNVSASKTKYDAFSQYDNDGKNGNANWGWVLGNYWQGNVGLSYNQSLAPFDDFVATEADIRTQKRQYIDAQWRFHPDWRASFSYSQFSLDYELAAQRPSERDTTTSEVGLDYVVKSGNSIGLQLRHTEADYASSVTNNFSQNELQAKVNWQLTGKTNLSFLGGVSKIEYSTGASRDRTDPSIRLTANWAATGKTSFALAAWQQNGGYDDLAANYSKNRGVNLSANWKATAKILVNAQVTNEDRNYDGLEVIAGVPPVDRKDRFQSASAGVTYSPLRQWQIRASLFRENLTSTVRPQEFRSVGVRLTTNYEF